MKHTEEESVQRLTVRRVFLTRAKLKASSRTSALMSGFAMVSFFSLSLDIALKKQRVACFNFAVVDHRKHTCD